MMEVRKLGAAMGAEILGADLNALSSDDFAQIRDAFHTHQVIAIRDQTLSPTAQIDFSRRFGALEDQLNAHYTVPDYPEVLVLSNDVKDGKPIGLIDGGDFWHSDSSHRECPSMATILYAVKNPRQGGDTEFASMYAAYDSLAPDMKRRIAPLKGIHAVSKLKNKRVTVSPRRPDGKDFYEKQKSLPDQSWPMVRTHPVTGRKALYVSPRFTIGIEGMDTAEADEILDDLFAHQIRPEFVYRHHWQNRDLVMWDNRAVIHQATGGYVYPDVRTMYRTVVAGDRPF
ncbi:MAG TPA: TauD/TfdA family dioxygenase [Micropepsaceae bacterium]|jgi:taurine dioxygenase